MNYLFHLYLADDTDDSLLGNLMGDFVKGPLDRFPPAIREGIEQHRRVDAYAQSDPSFRRSKRRLDDSLGLFKAIAVDIFYDHFLARNWDEFSPISLEEFAAHIYRLLEEKHSELPSGLQRIAPRMAVGDWLTSYRDLSVIHTVLERISLRISRPNPLARGTRELQIHYPALESDFRSFLPQAKAHLATFS